MRSVNISSYDLSVIWDVLMQFANGEGCVIAEELCKSAGTDQGMRIYHEVFSNENLQELFRVEKYRKSNIEPRDPPGWEGGFADNH